VGIEIPGRVYTVAWDNVALSAAADFLELDPAVDKPIFILGLVIGQTNRVGDAQEDELRWSIVRFTGATITSGSGGTTPTPAPVNPTDNAAGFTAEANNTTVASTTGTATTLHADVFNTRSGLFYKPAPEERVGAVDNSGNGKLLVRLLEAPAAATNFSGTATIFEAG
jgi:hypothetical protein